MKRQADSRPSDDDRRERRVPPSGPRDRPAMRGPPMNPPGRGGPRDAHFDMHGPPRGTGPIAPPVLPEDPEVLFEIPINKMHGGLVIGPGGESAARIRKTARVQVHVRREVLPGDIQIVELKGTASQCMVGVDIVRKIIQEKHPEAKIVDPKDSQAFLEVLPDMVGPILGARGVTVRKIRDETGATIKIGEIMDNGLQLVTISGTIQQVKGGYTMVKTILERVDPVRAKGTPLPVAARRGAPGPDPYMDYPPARGGHRDDGWYDEPPSRYGGPGPRGGPAYDDRMPGRGPSGYDQPPGRGPSMFNDNAISRSSARYDDRPSGQGRYDEGGYRGPSVQDAPSRMPPGFMGDTRGGDPLNMRGGDRGGDLRDGGGDMRGGDPRGHDQRGGDLRGGDMRGSGPAGAGSRDGYGPSSEGYSSRGGSGYGAGNGGAPNVGSMQMQQQAQAQQPQQAPQLSSLMTTLNAIPGLGSALAALIAQQQGGQEASPASAVGRQGAGTLGQLAGLLSGASSGPVAAREQDMGGYRQQQQQQQTNPYQYPTTDNVAAAAAQLQQQMAANPQGGGGSGSHMRYASASQQGGAGGSGGGGGSGSYTQQGYGY